MNGASLTLAPPLTLSPQQGFGLAVIGGGAMAIVLMPYHRANTLQALAHSD